MLTSDQLPDFAAWPPGTEIVLQVGDTLYHVDHWDGHDQAIFFVAGKELEESCRPPRRLD